VRFRVCSNDVGPHGYSGLTDIVAPSLDDAKRKAASKFGQLPVDPRRMDRTLRLALIPLDALDDIPGGTSRGGLKPASKYVVEVQRTANAKRTAQEHMPEAK
jgi:hypothetical protein